MRRLSSPVAYSAQVARNERAESLPYRWLAGDLVMREALRSGLAGPMLVQLRFEPSTVRGWRAPAEAGEADRMASVPAALHPSMRPALTLVA